MTKKNLNEEYSTQLMTEENLPFFNAVRNSCVDILHDGNSHSLDESIQWFRESTPEYYILHFNQENIGYFRTSMYDETYHSIYIGLDLDSRFRGLGHAKESYPLFMDFIAKEKHIKIFKLRVLKHNHIAFNLYQKIGFKVEGTTEKDYYMEKLI